MQSRYEPRRPDGWRGWRTGLALKQGVEQRGRRPGMNYVAIADVVRGEVVESRHYGAVVVADADGGLVAAAGDPDIITYPRSSLKPFQALPLIESGAADAFGLNDRQLALACASHR